MKFLVLAALAIACSAYIHPDNRAAIDDELLADIARKNASWKSGHNKFSNYTVADAKRLLGTKLDGYFPDVQVVDHTVGAIPTAFDARQQWPNCIHPIRNQEQCGSCWAFGATEALSDRLCIVTNGQTNVVLSPQDLVSCDNQDGNQGCNGGYPIKAWQYMQTTGVPSDSCYPYTSGGGNTGTCKFHSGSACPTSGQSNTVYHAASAYAVAQNVAAIQTEIMTNGPVEAAFEVYQDFFSYSGGVYKHVSGGLDGGHAVKIIGWGVDGGQPYWLVANSWGPTWGLQGFFMILRGVNECGIEAGIVAGKG